MEVGVLQKLRRGVVKEEHRRSLGKVSFSVKGVRNLEQLERHSIE